MVMWVSLIQLKIHEKIEERRTYIVEKYGAPPFETYATDRSEVPLIKLLTLNTFKYMKVFENNFIADMIYGVTT